MLCAVVQVSLPDQGRQPGKAEGKMQNVECRLRNLPIAECKLWIAEWEGRSGAPRGALGCLDHVLLFGRAAAGPADSAALLARAWRQRETQLIGRSGSTGSLSQRGL